MENRRATLGMLSMSNINAKPSTKQSEKNKKTRISLYTNNNAKTIKINSKVTPSVSKRRMSTGLRRSTLQTTNRLQDPRPIKDKEYQKSCIIQLVTYLTNHEYDIPISVKSLTAPSTKDFQNIIEFLFHQIDPNLRVTIDLVPNLFKQIHYPFPISRSYILSVGSPHSWPTILAALTWLVELLSYNEETLNSYSKESSEMVFYDYLGRSYYNFLNNEDEDGLDPTLVNLFQEKNNSVKQAVEQLKKSNVQMEQEINSIISSEEELTKLENRKNDLHSDSVKFSKIIEALTKHKDGVQEVITVKKEHLEQLKKEETEYKNKAISLESKIKEQESSSIDVQKIRLERAVLQRSIESLIRQKNNQETQINSLQENIENNQIKLEQNLSLFTELVEKLNINLDDIVKENQFEKDKFEEEKNLFSIHILKKIKPILQQTKLSLRSELKSITSTKITLSNENSQTEETLSDLLKQLEFAQNRLNKLEDAYKSEYQQLSNTLETINNKIQELQIENQRIKAAMSSEQSDKIISELFSKLKETKRNISTSQEQAKKEADNLIFLCFTSHNYLLNTINELQSNTVEILNKLKTGKLVK